MANTTLQTRIKLRTDIYSKWIEEDPILLKGETAVVLFTDDAEVEFTGEAKLKVGDGVHKFSELKYIGGDEAKVYQATILSIEEATQEAAIAKAVNGEKLAAGDVCIVKIQIADSEKYEYTAYTYTGTVWAAMDGNYNASNVYFDKDITLAGNYSSVGNVTLSSGTLSAKGKSLADVMTSIFTKELQPNKTLPSVKITLAQAGEYEVGISVTPTYTASLSTGSYTYGPATGITAKTWSVKNSVNDTTLATASGSFDTITVEDSMSYTVTATATYDAAPKAVTNLGNTSDVQIEAGAASATSGKITGYRAWFIGGTATATAIDSSLIRGLTKTKSISGNYAAADYNGGNIIKFIIAIPHSANKKLTSVLLASASNADITSEFVKQDTTVDVKGANDYTAIAYDVWVYQPAALDSTEVYTIKLG